MTWAQFLLLTEFVHNSWPHDWTTLTSHKLLFGTKPPFPLSDEEAKTPDVTTRLRQIREAWSKAEEALWILKEWLIPVNFEEGEHVWLEGCNLRTHHPTAKLAPWRYGSFPIDKKLLPVTYRLTLPPTIKIHPVFHIDLLAHYRETVAHGCYNLSLFLLIYSLFCLSLCAMPYLALFAFLCTCLITYLCVVLGHILHYS